VTAVARGRVLILVSAAAVLVLALDVTWLAVHHTRHPAPSWAQVTGPGFSVEFPGRPTPATRAVSIRNSPVAAHLLTLDAAHRVSYGLLYADYPNTVDVSDARSVLDGAAQGSARSVAGSLASTRFRTVVGHPAVDYVIRVKDIQIDGRTILVDHRLYSLLVGGPGTKVPTFARFTASFRLR